MTWLMSRNNSVHTRKLGSGDDIRTYSIGPDPVKVPDEDAMNLLSGGTMPIMVAPANKVKSQDPDDTGEKPAKGKGSKTK